DYFKKDSRTFYDRLSEYLEKISIVISIYKDSKLLEFRYIFFDLSYSPLKLGIISCRNIKEFDASFLKFLNSFDNIRCSESYVLNTAGFIEIYILFYL